MGMDVVGNNPSSAKGEYFRNNCWWWRPLWAYCCEVGKAIISEELAEQGGYNDGAGLEQEECLQLADLLDVEVASGATAKWSEGYAAWLASLPQVECEICHGTGQRDDNIVKGTCNGCSGTGKTDDFRKHYPFSVENVTNFIVFLRECGGFSIY